MCADVRAGLCTGANIGFGGIAGTIKGLVGTDTPVMVVLTAAVNVNGRVERRL